MNSSLTVDLVQVAGRALRVLARDSQLEAMGSSTPSLAVVQANAPVTVSHFARHYGCTQPSASQLLAKLERHGWVTRERDAHDRRVSTFRLTDEGQAQLATARRRAGELLSPALDTLDPGDLDALQRVISRLDAELDTMSRRRDD